MPSGRRIERSLRRRWNILASNTFRDGMHTSRWIDSCEARIAGHQTRQLRIGGQLAHFRTARPTGKVTAQSVERYEFFRNGHTVTLTLAGPVGADNVDPWRRITDSFAWSP